MCEALENLMKDVIEERVNLAVDINTKQVIEQVAKRVIEQKDKEKAINHLFSYVFNLNCMRRRTGDVVSVSGPP